nr:MAG TPA: hypothetical protein [Caudoviricetes sp.]
MKLTRSLRSLRQFHLFLLHQKIFFIKCNNFIFA